MAAVVRRIVGLLVFCSIQTSNALNIGSTRCPFVGMCGTDCLGTSYGGRYLLNDSLPFLASLNASEATVMVFGIGGDVSFEVGLACQYGFKIHLYDPSPNVPAHMEAVLALVGRRTTSGWRGALPAHSKCKTCKMYWNDVATSNVSASQLEYHEVAIAGADGNLTFYGSPKLSDKTGSWTLEPKLRPEGVPTVTVPAKNLTTLMQELGAKAIDILKLDVEGTEVAVFEQILALPAAALPKLIYADMDFMRQRTCSGTTSDCEEKINAGSRIIARLRAKGYSRKRYKHAADVVFSRLN